MGDEKQVAVCSAPVIGNELHIPTAIKHYSASGHWLKNADANQNPGPSTASGSSVVEPHWKTTWQRLNKWNMHRDTTQGLSSWSFILEK